MSVQSPEVVVDLQLETVGSVVEVTTGLMWRPAEAISVVNDFLDAWGEPQHPLYDPTNYGVGMRGKFPHEAFAAVPFIVALGGLQDHRKVTPARFADVATIFYETVNTDFDRDNPRLDATVDAVRRSIRIIESLGYSSFLEKDTDTREVVKDSNFFNGGQLRDIFVR